MAGERFGQETLRKYAKLTIEEKGGEQDAVSMALVSRTLEESLGTTYHALALDVEGTVTQPGSIEMEERICDVVAKTVRDGVHVIFVTGSGRTTIESIFSQLTPELADDKESLQRLYAISGNGCKLLTMNIDGSFNEVEIVKPLKVVIGDARYSDLVSSLNGRYGNAFKIDQKACGIRLVSKRPASDPGEVDDFRAWFDNDHSDLEEQGIRIVSGRWGPNRTFDLSLADKDHALAWFHTDYDFLDVPVLRIGDQGAEQGNDYCFLDSQFGFSVGSLSRNMTRCFPVYNEEENRILKGVEGTEHLLHMLKSGPSITIPSFSVLSHEHQYVTACEQLRHKSDQVFQQVMTRWSTSAKGILLESEIEEVKNSRFARVFDNKSGGIFFSDGEWRSLSSSERKDYFEESQQVDSGSGAPRMLRCLYTDNGRIMRGPRYYAGLVNGTPIDRARLVVDENIHLTKLVMGEIGPAAPKMSLAEWKLNLAILDNHRNTCLLLYSMLFEAATLNSSSQAYWKRLLRAFDSYISTSIGLYYSMLAFDLDATKLQLVDLRRSQSAIYEIRLVIDLLCDFLSVNKVSPDKIVRKWREADHPGQIYSSVCSVEREITALAAGGRSVCVLGIMYGGVELPFVVRQVLGKSMYPHLKIAHVGGISVYRRERGSLIMEQYSRDVLEAAIPNADRLEEIMAPGDVVIPFDDNIMTGRTMEVVRDRLNAYGVECPFSVCVRYPPSVRLHHMAKRHHGGVDPRALGTRIKGAVACSPYTRLFTSKEDHYKDALGDFDRSRKRMEQYLKKNGSQLAED